MTFWYCHQPQVVYALQPTKASTRLKLKMRPRYREIKKSGVLNLTSEDSVLLLRLLHLEHVRGQETVT